MTPTTPQPGSPLNGESVRLLMPGDLLLCSLGDSEVVFDRIAAHPGCVLLVGWPGYIAQGYLSFLRRPTAQADKTAPDVSEWGRFAIGQQVLVSDDQDLGRDRSYQDEVGAILQVNDGDDYKIEFPDGSRWNFQHSELSPVTPSAPSRMASDAPAEGVVEREKIIAALEGGACRTCGTLCDFVTECECERPTWRPRTQEEQVDAILAALTQAAPAPHCQLCGGTVQGWFCQTCEAEFHEESGLLVLKSEAAPADPVAGVGEPNLSAKGESRDTRAKIAIAFHDGAMAALGCQPWEDASDFFALVGQDCYAQCKPFPATMPKRSIPALSPSPGVADKLVALEGALRGALEWDKARGYRVPYRVRDPIYAALDNLQALAAARQTEEGA